MAAAEDSKGEPELPQVRTDPPPPGEEDPYGAATRVGPMSPTAIAKMMRDTEVPTASGLRSSIPRATPVPTVAPDVPALFNEAASGTEESDTSVRKERARDLHDLQNRSTPPASPLEAAPTAPATETWSAPQRPAAAFPEWIQTTTRDAEERESAEERQLVIRRAVIAGVYAVLAGLIVWWFLAH